MYSRLLFVFAIAFPVVAQAAMTVDWLEVDNQGTIPGYRTYDLVVHTEFATFSAAAMLFELTDGTFYQDLIGGTSILNPAFFSIFPTLEYDTYLMDDGEPVNVLGGGGDVGGNGLEFSMTELDVSWQAQAYPPQHQGPVRIARITMSADAAGTWDLFVLEFGLVSSGRFSGTVEDIVPEPGSLGLLALAGLVCWGRRARPAIC